MISGETSDAEPSQDTEAAIGPYELQDFPPLPYAPVRLSTYESRLPRVLLLA